MGNIVAVAAEGGGKLGALTSPPPRRHPASGTRLVSTIMTSPAVFKITSASDGLMHSPHIVLANHSGKQSISVSYMVDNQRNQRKHPSDLGSSTTQPQDDFGLDVKPIQRLGGSTLRTKNV